MGTGAPSCRCLPHCPTGGNSIVCEGFISREAPHGRGPNHPRFTAVSALRLAAPTPATYR